MMAHTNRSTVQIQTSSCRIYSFKK
uniref:Uncharacterized protein n=1 Tax=Anguilla anguilla TaxID=7936 RepID=A0A0E9SCA1_ANGAN